MLDLSRIFISDIPVGEEVAFSLTDTEIRIYEKIRSQVNLVPTTPYLQVYIKVRYYWETYVSWNNNWTRFYYGQPETGFEAITGMVIMLTSMFLVRIAKRQQTITFRRIA